MMNSDVALSTIVIYLLWAAGGGLVTSSWVFNVSALGQFGMMATAIAVTLTIVRDNNRTRRLIRQRGSDRTGRQS